MYQTCYFHDQQLPFSVAEDSLTQCGAFRGFQLLFLQKVIIYTLQLLTLDVLPLSEASLDASSRFAQQQLLEHV